MWQKDRINSSSSDSLSDDSLETMHLLSSSLLDQTLSDSVFIRSDTSETDSLDFSDDLEPVMLSLSCNNDKLFGNSLHEMRTQLKEHKNEDSKGDKQFSSKRSSVLSRYPRNFCWGEYHASDAGIHSALFVSRNIWTVGSITSDSSAASPPHSEQEEAHHLPNNENSVDLLGGDASFLDVHQHVDDSQGELGAFKKCLSAPQRVTDTVKNFTLPKLHQLENQEMLHGRKVTQHMHYKCKQLLDPDWVEGSHLDLHEAEERVWWVPSLAFSTRQLIPNFGSVSSENSAQDPVAFKKGPAEMKVTGEGLLTSKFLSLSVCYVSSVNLFALALKKAFCLEPYQVTIASRIKTFSFQVGLRWKLKGY